MFNAPDWDTPFTPTPFLMVQYLSFHEAVVKDVKDPWGVGRVRVECAGLAGEGKENWQGWLQMLGNPMGGPGQGDQGTWLPMQPGQTVYVAFLSGHPNALFAIPGPPFQKDQRTGKERNKQLVPLEAKIAAKNDPRDAARVAIPIKTPAGHTLLFDDRGKKEKLALVDWAGAGLFMCGPGKEEDEKEKEGEESKPRKGKRRGTKLVVSGDTEKPSELLRDGHYLLGLLDLIGQGVIQYCTDDAGMVAFFTKKQDGEIGPSLVIDSQSEAIFLTAGKVQLQILGQKGHIAVTRQIIQEIPKKADVESVIQAMLAAVGKEFEEFKQSGA